jgi:hypothetical protein
MFNLQPMDVLVFGVVVLLIRAVVRRGWGAR